MNAFQRACLLGSLAVLSSFPAQPDEDSPPGGECVFLSSQAQRPATEGKARRFLSAATGAVTSLLARLAGPRPAVAPAQAYRPGSVDAFIFQDLEARGIAPAPSTTDWEFIRRTTLDLTGRIPLPARVLAFVADTAPDKRARLIEELLASPAWVDKWTMYFGDLFQNTAVKPSTGVNRFPQGRNALYQWIRDSLGANKPYNQMASELIATAADNSYYSGPINYLVGGVVNNGPAQDTTDQMTANVAEGFLGITHVNCLLCHNGRGHLTALNLWGSQTTRYQAWQLASFLSHTQASRTPVDPAVTNVYYWRLQDNTKGYTSDYTLNTKSGNRPPRLAPDGCKSGQPCYYVAPKYIFNGEAPQPGEGYRAALARNLTGDPQFARALVNYMWAQFFGRGIVDPPNSFDPARLDPDNPPPAPWTLQPSNPRLLAALSSHFRDSGYDLKALMREIANSAAYQLSSRYEGVWDVSWEPYFARKFVRRLWAEELHDAIAQSSGNLQPYNMTGFTDQGFSPVSYAMQLPDVVGGPTGNGNAANFLNSFLRGNRDDQPRKQDGSILQALNLMNNPFVESRLAAAGATPSPLIVESLKLDNPALVNTLFLNVLSRYPSEAEGTAALAAVTGAPNRTQAVQDLVWALYNKVDFVFNY